MWGNGQAAGAWVPPPGYVPPPAFDEPDEHQHRRARAALASKRHMDVNSDAAERILMSPPKRLAGARSMLPPQVLREMVPSNASRIVEQLPSSHLAKLRSAYELRARRQSRMPTMKRNKSG